MAHKTLFIGGSCLLLLAGCTVASLKPVSNYAGPPETTTVIRFVNASSTEKISVGKFDDPITCEGMKVLQGAGAAQTKLGVTVENHGRSEPFQPLNPGETRTFRVEKGKPLTVFGWLATFDPRLITMCRLQATLISRQSEYTYIFNTERGVNCSTSIKADDGSHPPILIRPFQNPVLYSDGPFCLPMSAEQAKSLEL